MTAAKMLVETVRLAKFEINSKNWSLKTTIRSLVRQKAKDITDLLLNDARLRDERSSRTQMRDRMAGVDNIMADFQGARDRTPTYERAGYLDEDRDLRRALDESKRLAVEGGKKNNNEYVLI
jgi:epsin